MYLIWRRVEFIARLLRFYECCHLVSVHPLIRSQPCRRCVCPVRCLPYTFTPRSQFASIEDAFELERYTRRLEALHVWWGFCVPGAIWISFVRFRCAILNTRALSTPHISKTSVFWIHAILSCRQAPVLPFKCSYK